MQTLREKQGPPLPLSSLRLFVPPLRLVCAAMWQIVERRDIMDYGLLEEFATTVLDIVPELMTYRERVQLLMGLRARLILELCRCDDELCRPDTVQPHLNRIRSCISSQGVSDPKVEASEASFSKLIETLLEEPDERELFFQNVFPEEFGSKYDSTLQMLVQEFLSRLEKLLPPPNLQQTASWLSIAPALIEECVQSVAHPEPLQTLLRHQKNGQQLDTNALRSVGGDYILSSLSSRCSGKEGSASSEVGTERQSYPTMQGYQSPLPCDEPGMRWDCRLADYRVWTVKPPAGSACVEVEVDTIEVATEKSGKRKTIGKDTIKGTRRDKAVLCPQTRSGLKTSRLTASCLCRKPVLRLNRLDISNMPLPKSLLTLILRRGRLQGEATRRPGPKRRGRKKKRKKGHGVTNQKIETHALDVSDTPPPKSSLKLTLKRGIVQAEATSSQVPKKRGRKKGQKIGPGITKLKIEKIGAQTLDISDMPLPKPSLKLIIRRGKLQAEGTGSQGKIPKRRGRNKKHRRGRGIKDEKTEAKGVKRDRSVETEEEAKPSDYELWTTVRKGANVHKKATVEQCGGVIVGPHCPSTDKREEELQKHTLHVHSEEHCGQMAKGHNREELLEPSNTSQKIHFHSEEHSGKVAEGQKKEEVLPCVSLTERVPQDSLTERVHQFSLSKRLPQDSLTEKAHQDSQSKRVPQDSLTQRVPQDSLTQRVPQDLLTEKVPQDSLTEGVPQDSLTQRVPQDSLTKRVPQDSLKEMVPQDSLTKKVPQESLVQKVPQDSITERVPQDSLKERVPRDSLTQREPQNSLTEKVPQDSLTERVPPDSLTERVPQDSLTERVPQDSLTERVPQDSLTERVPQDSLTERVPQDSLTERVPQDSLTERVPQDSLTERVPQDSLTERVPQDSLTEKVPQESLTEKVPQESLTEKVSQDSPAPEPSNTCHKRSQRVKACSFCGKTFTDTLDLTRHMRSHIEQKSHQCIQCGQDFEFGEDLEEHQKNCEKIKKENDDYFGETVQQKPDLKKKNDRKRDKKPEIDEKPDMKGEEKTNLKADTQDSIKCHVCGKITTRMLGLRRHLLLHFNNGAFKCPVCPKTFISNADLRSHLRLKLSCREKCSDEVINTKFHLQPVPCQNICPYCGDTFQLPQELKGHTKECSRKCHVCGKTTSKACDMRRHLLKHYNNGPIKCPVCPKTFISHPDFKMHLKTKKLCREKCSDVMMKELLSSVEGKCKDNINETEVMTRSQQPSSSTTGVPVKSIEEFFEEFSHDLQQSDNSMSSEVNLNSLNSLDEDYSEDMTQYQPMKDVDLNNLHVDYNEISQYQPIKDVDLNNLHVDYNEEIIQHQPVKDDPEEDSMSVDKSGGKDISNDQEPNSDKGLTRNQTSHTDACPLQDSISEKSGEVKNEIQRGKLQAEATDSQEQKRRGRKRKQKRGRGVKNEKTEAKGVNRERANETEEDAEPSKNELRTTVTKAATVNDSGGVHVRLHSPSSHKKKKLQQHNFQSEHCGQMAKWQRRELLEGVPQDSLTPEPSNTCHKRSQRVKACSFCGKTFTDTLDLTRHMRSHIEQKSHQCIQCGQDFEFGEDLEEHQNNVCKVNKNNNDEDNNKDSCKETNERNTNLVKKHLKRDKNTKRKRDNKTDLKVDFQVDEKPVLKEEGKTDLKEYEKPDLNEDEKPDLKGDTQHCSIKCHVCGKITTRMLGLRRHLLVHFNNGAYKCPVCPKTFTTNADLRSHLRLKRSCREKCSEEFIMTKVHLQPVPCQNICPYCGDTFQLPHDLKGHTKECSRKCHVCGKTTLKACNMRRHILKHYNNGPIKCPVCPKTFISHPDFKMHLKTKKCCREKCSDVMMKELLSSVEGKCKENINETEVMTRSQQPSSSNTGGPGKSMEEFFEQLAHDQPDNSVNCDSLHVDFNDEICQNQPIENIDQSKPCEYKCPYCRATFQLPHDLKGHTKECSRKCHVCGKTTSKACDMRRHMLKHYNNGPIKCPVCPKTFIFHTDLKIHLKTKKICRENCSDVMMKELLSSVDGRRIKKVNKTGVKKCQQPSSSNTNGPVLGLKSFEKLFEELHDDSQPANNNISSDVNINSFHENYSDKINHYEPMNDVDLKSLDDHKDRISHKLTMRDIDKSNPTKFNCPYCGDTFQLPHDLKGHTKNCSRKCHVCGKTSSKTCDMRRHMLKHDNNGPIKCPVCPKTFIFHTDLKTHLKTKKFCREKCSDVMAKELLSSVDSKHRKKLNKTKVMTKCQPPSSSSTSVPVLGLKSFEEFFEELSHDSDISMSSDVNLISLHEETSSRSSHNQPSDVNLISLHEETSSRSSHNEPIKDTGQSNPGEYKCPYCGDTFQLPHDLKGHTKECSRKCNVCGKTTSTTCGMRRHMLKHYNNGSHKCPVCPKTFIFYTDMKKHLKTKKLCRENFSNLTAEESLSSADGQYKEHVNETGIMTRCQQPSSSNTDRPVLGLKTFEEFFEELSQDQPDEGMSNDCHHVDFNEEISQYQPMKDVDLNNLQEDYSDEINQYQPMNDVDLNSLHGHYSNDISQY
ncbi:uncharacterized protein LOC106024859 isoform X2 [Esox lucius]|uniref:C2H2-type domain-containing protein n=1 Tax=Esox lucius TaxID=8010 RepID=A0AAY5K2K4_ESOLU|nr:uncharacterized protein LOC106024859 isoform X2 [Esox lucius]